MAGGQRPRSDGFGEERRRMFLAALREGYGVLDACALVGISNRTAYNHRAADAAFARDWALARRASTLPLELAAFQRAVDGVEEPVYAYGRFSHVRVRRSDYLLARLLAAERPEKFGRTVGARVEAALRKRLKRLARRVQALEAREEGRMRSARISGAVKVVNRRPRQRSPGGWRLARALRRAQGPEFSSAGGES